MNILIQKRSNFHFFRDREKPRKQLYKNRSMIEKKKSIEVYDQNGLLYLSYESF